MTLKQELLNIPKGTWYTIGANRNRDEVVTTVKELISENHIFQLNEQETKFVYVGEKVVEYKITLNCFFDLKDEPGYRVEKRSLEYGKQCEDIYYGDKLLATR